MLFLKVIMVEVDVALEDVDTEVVDVDLVLGVATVVIVAVV